MQKMFAAERRQKILDYLNKQHRVTVKELSELLNVSEATLRTDLDIMEEEGVLQRIHGGAILPENLRLRSEYSFSVREKSNKESKIAISQKAIELLKDDQCILLDASTTALELARLLIKRRERLTVLTNGIYTALELKENPDITVIMIGGVLRIGSVAVEGKLGASILDQINIDTMFTSASGFSIEEGLTDFNVYEVELKRMMVKSSSRVVALLDHSKIGKSSIASFADLTEIDYFITDQKAPEEVIQKIKDKGVNVLKA